MAAFSTIAAVTIAAATVASTVNQYNQQRRNARAVEKQGEYEALLFEDNATRAEAQAQDTIARGHELQTDVVRGQRMLTGAQRASFAAQGIAADVGSARDVIESDAGLADIDRERIRRNALREATGFRDEASIYRKQAQWTREGARFQAQAIRNQSGVTLLAGAVDLAAQYRSRPRGISRAPSSSAGYGTSVYAGNRYGMLG